MIRVSVLGIFYPSLPSLLVRIYSDIREIFYNWIKFQIFQRDQESNYFRKYLATVWKKG